ncbi:hypothetical protein [Larkinella terrae]|uniref:Uncharacterized protein n=1 Tax=Larkinella terrae TaxID=2025311 RepID=A0A7K0ET73_9BACT|nr:hypothetical protein [Larkinella terrae]MRS64969.1 hypothetical protein [Larkinella terrae]
MKNKRVWGIFLRKPTMAEWMIFGMSAVLILVTILPTVSAKTYRISGVICCLGFIALFVRETQSDYPRYFYKWLWALFGIVKVNVKLVDEIFLRQTWQLFDLVLIIVLLRSIHSYNTENDRKPLFFRRPYRPVTQ